MSEVPLYRRFRWCITCGLFTKSLCSPLCAVRCQLSGESRDWYCIAEQPAPAPHLAHPVGSRFQSTAWNMPPLLNSTVCNGAPLPDSQRIAPSSPDAHPPTAMSCSVWFLGYETSKLFTILLLRLVTSLNRRVSRRPRPRLSPLRRLP